MTGLPQPTDGDRVPGAKGDVLTWADRVRDWLSVIFEIIWGVLTFWR